MDEKVVFSMANWYTATREKTRPGQPGTIRNWRNAMSLPPPTFRCLFATLIMAIIVLSFTVDAPAKTWIVDDSGGPGVDFTDIETLPDPAGRPLLTLRGVSAELARTLGITQVLLSISHSGEYAVASVIGLGTG